MTKRFNAEFPDETFNALDYLIEQRPGISSKKEAAIAAITFAAYHVKNTEEGQVHLYVPSEYAGEVIQDGRIVLVPHFHPIDRLEL